MKEQPSQRPNIDQIVIELKKALESQRKRGNPVYNSMVVGTSKSIKGTNLEHLQIPLADIKKATGNFAEEYLIGSGTYGDVYKAELDHFDCQILLTSEVQNEGKLHKQLFSLEEKNKGKFQKKRHTVAIKRIFIRQYMEGEQGFLAEIEMLTNCKHPNIVSLLGFCGQGQHMILVYEHASNGSLDDYLCGCTRANLTWVQRIKICIDVARGLNYLHTRIEDNRRIIHRDIKSGNILLGENMEAKIADFGLSKFRPENQQLNTLHTNNIAGTQVYLDPEYDKKGKLKNESDIYSFGVVLFEMLSGTIANDPIYTKYNSNGIAPVARRRFNEGTIKEMIDPRLMEEEYEFTLYVSKGPDQDSLDAYAKIAYQCVAETQVERPTAEVVIKKLEEALSFQENSKDRLKFSLADITLATKDFSEDCLISSGGYVYKGEVKNANGWKIIAAKWFPRYNDQEEPEFVTELKILLKYQHENIIGLVGYCNETSKSVILYDYASRTSLDMHLADNGLTWIKRLEICIGIASGLDFLHGKLVIHNDIKSSNILLNDDWIAKITHFGFSLIRSLNKDMGATSFVDDPLYGDWGLQTKESDIYSFGVVLLEILCGRLAFQYRNSQPQPLLIALFKHHYEEGTLGEIVFEGIKEQIVPKSMSTFQMIIHQCIFHKRKQRPTASEVLLQLRKALEFQMENTSDNTMDTANNRMIAPKTDELVPPLEHNVVVSPNSHADQPEKFNGSNFKEWQQKMLLYLTTLNLAEFLTDDAPESNTQVGDIEAPGVVEAWKHSDFLCRNYVLNGLVEALSNKHSISRAKTAKELWESLEREYNTEDVDVVARFLEYKMEESKSIVEQVRELQIIMQDIHAEGTLMSEIFQVDVIIAKLPPAWVGFKKSLKHKRKEMSVEDLIVQLQIEEDNNKLAVEKRKAKAKGKAKVFEHDV
ncbi:hypothetical protein L1887_18383 [Cichorium endivia]|nr:hypothetical protein L1887_18383 [Cichorium endivia]